MWECSIPCLLYTSGIQTAGFPADWHWNFDWSLPSLYAIHLLHSLEYGTNYAYSSNKANEARLATVGIASMSPLTAALLNGIDYDEVQQKRRHNVRILHQILKPYNRFPLSPGCLLYTSRCV